MKTQGSISGLLYFVFFGAFVCPAYSNTYIIIYATCDGNTGHAGIAVDRHQVISYDIASSAALISKTDTLETGRMYYYDFWPENDVFIRKHFNRDLEPNYYKLPQSSSEADITITSLLRKGIPHKQHQPVDGIIEIRTTPGQDMDLISYFDGLIDQHKPFNARTYNCVDFVICGLNHVLHTAISAKEFVPFSRSSTPNKLFRKVAGEKRISSRIIADPGEKIRGSFLSQKVIPEVFKRLKQKLNSKDKTHDERTLTIDDGCFSRHDFHLCPGT